MPAPNQSFELTIAAAYPHATLDLGDSRGGPNVALELAFGARLTRWSFGVLGQYAELGGSHDARVYSAHAGLLVAYHLRPDERLDPWLGIGTGFRSLRLGQESRRGYEVARLVAGADLRTSPLVVLGPIASVAADLFPSADSAAAGPWIMVALIGLQGRIDFSPAVIGD